MYLCGYAALTVYVILVLDVWTGGEAYLANIRSAHPSAADK
jgi:hypothetical protein